MQTFWILLAAVLVTSAFMFVLYKLGAFRKKGVKPGTVIAVGWGHHYHKGGGVVIDQVPYHVVDTTEMSITVGERVGR